jgi:acetate kinase
MGGIDLLVFTGGVGENGPEMREYICSNMEFLGIDFDYDVNRGLKGQDKVLTKPESKTKVVVIGTNEELVIATDTFNIVSNLNK